MQKSDSTIRHGILILARAPHGAKDLRGNRAVSLSPSPAAILGLVCAGDQQVVDPFGLPFFGSRIDLLLQELAVDFDLRITVKPRTINEVIGKCRVGFEGRGQGKLLTSSKE